MNRELTIDDLSPRERVVFLASCRLQDTAADGRIPVLCDPDYGPECEHLAELGWLERIEVEDEPARYRLSPQARNANAVQSLIEQAHSTGVGKKSPAPASAQAGRESFAA